MAFVFTYLDNCFSRAAREGPSSSLKSTGVAGSSFSGNVNEERPLIVIASDDEVFDSIERFVSGRFKLALINSPRYESGVTFLR